MVRRRGFVTGWGTYLDRSWLLASWSFLVTVLIVSASSAQTLGIRPDPYIIQDCGKIQGICCPGPLVWGFDPYGGCDHCSDCLGDCRTGFTAHRPATWYGSVDVMALTLNRSDVVNFAQLGPTGDVVLSTSDLRPEFDAGARATVGRTFGECFQAEFVYMGNFEWVDSQVVASPTGELSSILSGFVDPADPIFDENNSVSARVASRMATAEVNLRTWIEMPSSVFDLQLLVGARYFAASDQLQFVSNGERAALADIATHDVSVATDNDLYGVQIGMNSKWLLHRLFFLDFEGKVALCENFVTQSTSYIQTDGNGASLPAITTNNSSSRTSLLGDLMLTANFQLRPNITLRVGYQALIVNGLATGPQNLPSNSFLLTNGIGQFRDNGDMVYHGPTIGLVGAW